MDTMRTKGTETIYDLFSALSSTMKAYSKEVSSVMEKAAEAISSGDEITIKNVVYQSSKDLQGLDIEESIFRSVQNSIVNLAITELAVRKQNTSTIH